MGQTVYVLTTLEGAEGKKANREWRPVGVTTNLDTADKWTASGNNNDWIPFELDDVSGMGDITPFRPGKPKSDMDKATEYIQRLEAANQKLLKIVEQLQKGKKRSAKSSLLKKKE